MSTEALLSLLSAVVAVMTLVVGLGSIFAFFNLRSVAREVAHEEATTVALDISETAAVAYLDQAMPSPIVSLT